MHEMGMGVTGINPNMGTARNPHNDQHVTGGSSSGSAVSVSSGIVPFAIGNTYVESSSVRPRISISFSVLLKTRSWGL